MRKSKKLLCSILAATTLSTAILPTPAFLLTTEAHSGRTDSNGGHKDNKNASGLGYYHYHCGGYPAHLHKQGVCPYSSTSSTSTTKKSSTSSTVKKVQTALNKKGYDCGTADGIMGKKTKAALKKFQKDNNLTVDGKIGKQVKKALNIS